MNKLLEYELDDSIAKFLVTRMNEWKKDLEAKFVTRLDEAVKERSKQLMAAAEADVQEIKESYAAQFAEAVNEKNEAVDALNNQLNEFKKELSGNVKLFLRNAKEELYGVVAEEIRLNPSVASAQKVLGEVKALVAPVVNESIDVSRISRLHEREKGTLTEDNNHLKERLGVKNKVIDQLKAQLRVKELVENAPTSDRQAFTDSLNECKTVAEVESKYQKVTENLKKKRLDESAKVEAKGRVDEARQPEARPVLESTDNQASERMNRMQQFAGIKK